MWVVKLGGSLLSSPCLSRVLTDIVSVASGQCVIVPGGGLFADAVRDSQQRYRFNDLTAHKMAVNAMEQYGLLLASLCPQLSPIHQIAKMTDTINAGTVPLWLPYQSLEDFRELPANWQVSADSIALWLATQLDNASLLLVKSLAAPSLHISELVEKNCLDHFFPSLLKKSPLPVVWWHAEAKQELKQLFGSQAIRADRLLINV